MTALVGVQVEMFPDTTWADEPWTEPAGEVSIVALAVVEPVLIGAPAVAADDELPDTEPDLSHAWAIAAIALVDHHTAKHANLRGSFRTADQQRIEALDVYCSGCRRPFDDVADDPCEAKIDNTHLIGGDPGVRKKRLIYAPEGKVVAGPSVSRQGAAAFINGDGAPVG